MFQILGKFFSSENTKNGGECENELNVSVIVSIYLKSQELTF
jgi:hypothetical protein